MNYCANKNLSIRNSGFSLIEALVAFMIISVGMLGIASLQTISMKAGHTAVVRTSAVVKVEDILDRMRANKSQLIAYNSSVFSMGTNNSCSDEVGSSGAPNTVTSAATACDPSQLAKDDIYRWKRSMPPNVKASIKVDEFPPPRVLTMVTVKIIWTERAVADTALATANNFEVIVEM